MLGGFGPARPHRTMKGTHAMADDRTSNVGSAETTLTWYRREELEQLAKDYAALRGMTMEAWGRVHTSEGAFVSWGGWRGLVACLFTWRIIDSVSWRERDEYGIW